MGGGREPLAAMSALGVRIDAKRFALNGGQVTAVEGLNFSVGEGEFVCILGPSGCGKTTTLNIIAGLDKDFSGEIQRDKGIAERRLGYVFQTPRLLPWRSVLDNILLATGGDLARRATATRLLNQVGLAGFEHAFPGQLSLGMQRRAALARAFAVEPGLLLMDEPFVSLDEPTAVRLRAVLLALWREHPVTVIFVTHDSREAIQLGTRLLVLSPAPARIMADLSVPLTAQQRADPAEIEAFRKEKLSLVTEPRAPEAPPQYDGRMNGASRT
jgi:ABC-type nitrate/sulfonate/bicarbonate transport system ATPase subunit